MKKTDQPYDEIFHQSDYYLAQSRLYVDQYLAEHGLTRDMLLEMPRETAAAILKQALEEAAVQIARLDAMIRLGNRDVDTKEEPPPKHKHEDRLARYLHKNVKQSSQA